jgi:BirA family biotin operon repressor/biotin-[acetyl-CoA-carboxylase] ligase
MDWVAQAVQPTRWLAKVWRFYERVSSTQDEAKAWVQQSAPHGGMVIADEQTKGRGRWGRTWFSPPRKNLHLTLTMKLPAEHPPLGTLSLLTGVAIVEALRQRFSVPAFVKWVNDVVVDGKKLAGILIERVGSDWALIGIGVNVNLAETDLPDELRTTATSLQMVKGTPVDRTEVLSTLLVSLESWWERWAQGAMGSVWQALEGWDWLRDKSVTAHLPDGTTLHGFAVGITPDGGLRLRLDDGTERTLTAGDVTVRW